MSVRRFIARTGARLLSSIGFQQIFEALNRPGGGCIVCYHHISAATLEKQLELLSRRYAIVSLDDVVSRLEAGTSTAGLMAITFDDGFAEEVESGAELALRKGWPMTFYLPTGFVASGQPYWFETVAPLLMAAPDGEYEIDGQILRLGSEASRRKARDRIVRHLFHRPASEIDPMMEKLRRILFGSGRSPAELEIPGPVSRRRVRELSRHEEVAFQAHSVTHPFFCRLVPQEIRREMEICRREVEEMTGRSVEHFCYPYGDVASIGSQAPEMARQLFRSATTILHGRCHPEVDLAMLPRIPLFEHDTEAMAGFRVGRTR